MVRVLAFLEPQCLTVAVEPLRSLTDRATGDRLRRVWKRTRNIWPGEDDLPHALNFLFRGHFMLDNRRPIDLILESEEGAKRFEGILARIESETSV